MIVRVKLLSLATLVLLVNICVLYYYHNAQSTTIPSVVLTDVERMMIVATHQDDAVIMAGGAAIQHASKGGETLIVYFTAAKVGSDIRQKEAEDVWSNLPNVTLEFYDYVDIEGMDVETLESRLLSSVNRFKPDRVFAPLPEGGHLEHDITGIVVKRVAKKIEGVEFIYSAEYNPYFAPEYHAEKFFWFLVRLMPFLDYKEVNAGYQPEFQQRLLMAPEELELKKSMLYGFVSQRNVIPISQFGVPDLYDQSEEFGVPTVKIGSKFFSYWGITMLLSVSIWLFVLGICVGKYKAFLICGLGFVGTFVVGVFYFSSFVLEEALFLAIFFLGILFYRISESGLAFSRS